MTSSFSRIDAPKNLHDCVTRSLALQVIQAERASSVLEFPNEAELCRQLGVSRSILREAVKVLADKGMVEVRPRSGTRSRPRSEWNLLDPDILGWQAELGPDARFLRDLCEVRLAFEPTASGFAALRATPEEVEAIERCLDVEDAIEAELRFHAAVVEASHNDLFRRLAATIRAPLRTALSYTAGLPASYHLGMEAYHTLAAAIRRHDPLAARAASDEIVGLAMLAVEQVVRMMESRR